MAYYGNTYQEPDWDSENDSTWEDDEDYEEVRSSRARHTQGYSWGGSRSRAAADMQRYRHGYPDPMPNLLFYRNEIPFEPNGTYIEDIHSYWKDDYYTLERNHSYIQWLFPLQEPGVNRHATPLTPKELQLMKNDEEVRRRFLESYKLMLGFYGILLVDEECGKVARAQNWESRFYNMDEHTHNNLRITRILKCLGEMDYQHYQAPLVRFFLEETLCSNNLQNVKRSVLDYFMFTVRDRKERKELVLFAWENYEPKGGFIWGPREVLQKLKPVQVSWEDYGIGDVKEPGRGNEEDDHDLMEPGREDNANDLKEPGREDGDDRNDPKEPGREDNNDGNDLKEPAREDDDGNDLKEPGKEGNDDANDLKEPGKEGNDDANDLKEPGKEGNDDANDLKEHGREDDDDTDDLKEHGKEDNNNSEKLESEVGAEDSQQGEVIPASSLLTSLPVFIEDHYKNTAQGQGVQELRPCLTSPSCESEKPVLEKEGNTYAGMIDDEDQSKAGDQGEDSGFREDITHLPSKEDIKNMDSKNKSSCEDNAKHVTTQNVAQLKSSVKEDKQKVKSEEDSSCNINKENYLVSGISGQDQNEGSIGVRNKANEDQSENDKQEPSGDITNKATKEDNEDQIRNSKSILKIDGLHEHIEKHGENNEAET